MLTKHGLTIKRAPEVLDDIVSAEQANIDPNLNVNDDTLIGQLNNILASSIAEQWALAQAVYDNFNIDKAEGKNLDDLAALRGATRISASFTSGTQEFIGQDGTTILAGSVLANPTSGDRFTVSNQITISTLQCYSCVYSVNNVLDNTLYTLEVNSTEYSYTSGVGATANDIVTGLKADMDLDTGITFTATVIGDTLTLVVDSGTTLSAFSTTYLSADVVTVRSLIQAEAAGPNVAPAGAVTQIVTNIAGWDSTNNPDQLVLGRLEETDEELRVRIPLITSSGSTGTVPSIEGALLANIDGITATKVVENTDSVPDGNGRPAHSYETIVVGGDNTEIAEEIWRTKPSGIKLYGNTNIVIQDSNGNPRSIDFTRPVAVNLAFRVQYTKYDEESFPSDGNSTIAATILNQVQALGIDEDVIPSRFFGPVYSSVSGIDGLTIELQQITNPGDSPLPGSWQEGRFAIDEDEFSNTTSIDISVAEI